MSIQNYFFEQEKIKPILTSFINCGCDYNAMPMALKKPMRAYVHDNIPYVWLSDGYHFIEAIFTKDAINEFRKLYTPKHSFSQLRDKMIMISKWSLKIKQVESNKYYTSYQNLTVQLIVEHFKPQSYEKPMPKQILQTICLFRDPEVQVMIRHRRHQVMKDVLAKHCYYHGGQDATEMPSMKDVLSGAQKFPFKAIRNDDDIDMENSSEEEKPKIDNSDI